MSMSDTQTKRCMECGRTKPAAEFSRRARSRDGLNVRCKPCNRALQSAFRVTHADDLRAWREAYYAKPENAERHRENRRRWWAENAPELRAQLRARRRTAEGRARDTAYMRDYTQRPEVRAKNKARQRLNDAVRDGRVAKPTACEWCARALPLEGHHEDYSKPLEVAWLCRRCHVVRHRTARRKRAA